MAKDETYVARIVRAFISYSHHDGRLAGGIKSKLEEYGIAVFLAHEDIAPTRPWQEIILANLKRCDVFLPLLTKDFPNSPWVDQESGIAIAADKFIVPLKLDIDPYGFIGKYQALKFDRRMYGESCRRIVKIIANRDEFAEAVKDCVIRSFLNSNTFDQANRRSHILQECGPYSKQQLNETIRGSSRNGQIYNGFTAKYVVSQLIAANHRKVDRKARKEFEMRAQL